VAAVVLFSPMAALDTGDHGILLSRLDNDVRVQGTYPGLGPSFPAVVKFFRVPVSYRPSHSYLW